MNNSGLENDEFDNPLEDRLEVEVFSLKHQIDDHLKFHQKNNTPSESSNLPINSNMSTSSLSMGNSFVLQPKASSFSQSNQSQHSKQVRITQSKNQNEAKEQKNHQKIMEYQSQLEEAKTKLKTYHKVLKEKEEIFKEYEKEKKNHNIAKAKIENLQNRLKMEDTKKQNIIASYTEQVNGLNSRINTMLREKDILLSQGGLNAGNINESEMKRLNEQINILTKVKGEQRAIIETQNEEIGELRSKNAQLGLQIRSLTQ